MLLWLLVFQVNPIQFLIYDLITAVLVTDHTPKVAVDDVPVNAIFLDTRTKLEYAISHLPNAQWIGPQADEMDTQAIAKNHPIVVYCSIGYRSGQVGEQLLKQGYTQVYNLDGGLFKWHNQYKPVVRNGNTTKDIHPYSAFWGLWLENANRIYQLPEEKKVHTSVER
ncbi:MAG: rhodanese-like domain-containing protein [Flammeovirgaceae bacterium]